MVLFLCTTALTGTLLGFKPEDMERLRSTGSCKGCDLSGNYLGGFDLRGAQLERANLSI